MCKQQEGCIMLYPVSNGRYLLSCVMLLLRESKCADLVSLESVCGFFAPTLSTFSCPTFVETRCKTCTQRKVSKMSLIELIYLFIPGEWCVMHPWHVELF
jgi:hypothetical protein